MGLKYYYSAMLTDGAGTSAGAASQLTVMPELPVKEIRRKDK
jgi:hypothetical protein